MRYSFRVCLLGSIFIMSSIYAQQLNSTQRGSAYEQSISKAKLKVREFRNALKSRDPARIKKATLKIQSDPVAIKQLNKENVFVKKKFVNTTDMIQSKTIENIKQNVAKRYGVRPEEVRVKKFTNPSSKIKAGHDWDVTVSVKGKGEIPLKNAKAIVHESYYDAAGGKKAYPNSNPKKFADTHHVEVTNTVHAEAYEGGKKFIDNPKDYKVKDPERLSKTIEHKSNLDRNKAIEYSKAGKHGKAEVYKHEQARQYTKQYEKIIEPRVKNMGGKVPKVVKEGTNILNKIGKYDTKLGRTYTPADAESSLTKIGQHGESIESIIKKGSSLVESGQKLKQKSNPKKLTSADPDDLTRNHKAQSTTKQKSISDMDGSGKTKGGETAKGKAGRLLGEYMDGAMVINQADKIRQGIKERDVTKIAEGIAGEDTAKRTEVEGGKQYVNDMNRLQEAREAEAESAAVVKLKRMGATKKEIEEYRENYGKSKSRKVVQKVKLRGGKDKKPQKGFSVDNLQEDSWTSKEQLMDGVNQSGSYGKTILDGVSLGGVNRSDISKHDLSDIVDQADNVYKRTEESVISRLYVELRNRGASKEESKAALKNYLNDRRDVQELVEKLKQRDPEKAKGSNRKRDGLAVDNINVEKDDEGAVNRVKNTFSDTGIGMKDMLIKPIEFVNDTTKDFTDIANDAMEITGIGSDKNQQVLHTNSMNIELKHQNQNKYKKLINLGASEREANDALTGKSGSINKLTKKLHKIEADRQKTKEIREKVREQLRKKKELNKGKKKIKEGKVEKVKKDIEVQDYSPEIQKQSQEILDILDRIASHKYGKNWQKKKQYPLNKFIDIIYDNVKNDKVLDIKNSLHLKLMSTLMSTKLIYGAGSKEYKIALKYFNKKRKEIKEALIIPPVKLKIIGTVNIFWGYKEDQYVEKLTLIFSFWNVGNQVPGYGGVKLKFKSISLPGGKTKVTYHKGTFSGGPNGVIRINVNGDDSIIKLHGGHSISGEGIDFKIPNPSAFKSAFQYWNK